MKHSRTAGLIAMIGVTGIAVAGCSGGSNGGGGELESLSIMVPYFSPTAPESDDPVGAALNELTGVDLDIRWSPNAEYGTQTNVVLAGDDVPDVMVVQSKNQGFVQTAEAGGFWDLTEYIESGDYPNLVPVSEEAQEAASVNGKVYGVLRARDLMRFSLVLRADWLENLGLEAPTTTEELAEVARAFSEDDPDGNGVDDTYGLIDIVWPGVGVQNPLDARDVWFGAGNTWRDDDGELVPSWTTDEWKDSLNYSRELFQNGWTNPDFPTKDGQTWSQAFINGEGGILIAVSSNATDIVNLVKDTDPDNADRYVTVTTQPESPNGKFALPTNGYSGFLAISKSNIQTEEQLRQVLEVLDTLNTPEAQRLLNNGIEGENYTVEDGLAAYNPEQAALTTFVQQAWLQLNTSVNGNEFYLPKQASDYEQNLYDTRLAIAEEDLEYAVFNPAAGLVSETYITNATTLDQIISDARMQYIAGEISEAQLDDAIERWRTSGGDTVTAELNELYQG